MNRDDAAGLAKAAFLEGWSLGHSQGRVCGEAGYEQKDKTCCPDHRPAWDYAQRAAEIIASREGT